MKLFWQISAGEFFELLRPAALVTSALLSTWVLASARRWGFRFAGVSAWTIGSFLFPFIILPIYLIARASIKRSTTIKPTDQEAPAEASSSPPPKLRFLLPAVYGLVLLSLIGIYLYRDYYSIDAHLARAAQAKVMNNHPKALREYRAALTLEDSPHTHKLLGMELALTQQWTESLRELRAAESGGEPDDSLSFRIAQALEANGQTKEALTEFKRFLDSQACTDLQPDSRCHTARDRILNASRQGSPVTKHF